MLVALDPAKLRDTVNKILILSYLLQEDFAPWNQLFVPSKANLRSHHVSTYQSEMQDPQNTARSNHLYYAGKFRPVTSLQHLATIRPLQDLFLKPIILIRYRHACHIIC
jgi:hypothetical protein